MQKGVEEDIAKAAQICAERIKTRRMPQQIEREIIQIHDQIKQEENTQDDLQNIINKLNVLMQRYYGTCQ